MAHIFNPSNEDEQKEFKGVEVAISDLTRERMSKAEVMENDDILEDLKCSDETFILFLKNVTFDDGKDGNYILGLGFKSCEGPGLQGLSELCSYSGEIIY